MKTYDELINDLYNRFPMYQQKGSVAYKPGLQNALDLDNHFGHPHRAFKTIHIAGTNGKGSTSHLLAAILTCSGYKTGLYTSPHLTDFRERIRVNGEMITREAVAHFLTHHSDEVFAFRPSFFELTTFMAFNYFAQHHIDVAVVETGLGGRLDTTNIIAPHLSIITNISLDHIQLLGNTLTDIAREKAGIIKPHTPVVIGEAEGEVKEVFMQTAAACEAPITFACDGSWWSSIVPDNGGWRYIGTYAGDIRGELGGEYQKKNAATVLAAVQQLRLQGYHITDSAIIEGFARVTELTGLQGRWQRVAEHPTIICDTGHNIGGMQYITRQLQAMPCKTLRIVIGMVSDKDIRGVISMLPRNAVYYFTQASVARAMKATEIAHIGSEAGLRGETYATVKEAVAAAIAHSDEQDVIFVGGSTFVVADFLASYNACS